MTVRGLLLGQGKSAYIYLNLFLPQNPSPSNIFSLFSLFSSSSYYDGWGEHNPWTKTVHSCQVKISRLSCGILRDTRNALLFMHPEICPGVSRNGRCTTFGEPVPASSQCLFCCWYMSVLVSTNGYFCVHLGTCKYLWMYLVTFGDEPVFFCKMAEHQLNIVFSIVLHKMPRQHNL